LAKGKAALLHGIMAYRGVELQLQASLASALDRGDWSGSRFDRFIPKSSTPANI